MKVKITSDYEYTGKNSPQIDIFYLEVEKELASETPGEVANTYLGLRKKLKAGIREDS